MILLDTNVLSELMRVDVSKQVISWLDLQAASSLFICSITRAEVELGEPQGQGKGFGYKLIEKFCQGLINQGIQGVHLGVGRANTRACLFYQKCGFTVLEENEQEFIYGKKLF